jgi:hypothetical protein
LNYQELGKNFWEKLLHSKKSPRYAFIKRFWRRMKKTGIVGEARGKR